MGPTGCYWFYLDSAGSTRYWTYPSQSDRTVGIRWNRQFKVVKALLPIVVRQVEGTDRCKEEEEDLREQEGVAPSQFQHVPTASSWF